MLFVWYNFHVTDSIFLRAVYGTWIAGLVIAALLFILDYDSFARSRRLGLAEVTERLEMLDELLRAAQKVEADLPVGEGSTYGEIEDYRESLQEWGSVVSEYDQDYLDKRFSFYPEADNVILDGDSLLGKLRARLSALASLADNMVDNFEEARRLRSQARLSEAGARQYDDPWAWSMQMDLYLAANAYRESAGYYETKARMTINTIGEKRAEMRREIDSIRRGIENARGSSKERSSESYLSHLGKQAVDFNLKDSIPPALYKP